MTLYQAINLLVTVTLVEMMVALGLGVAFADLVAVAKNGRLVAQALLASYVVVPAVTVGLLLLFAAGPLTAAGFLVLAVCPGAPYGPPLTALARGNVAAAVGLMVVLAGSSAVLAPVLLSVFLPALSENQPLRIDTLKIVVILLVTQLLPLCAGVAVRQWRPLLAGRLQKPANRVGTVLNLSVIVCILVAQFDLLAEIRVRGLAGMLALLLASLGAGWLLGGPGHDGRKAMTLTTALRNVGVGLVIATGSFAGTPAVTAVVAYGLFQVAGALLLALAWGYREEKKGGKDQRPLDVPGFEKKSP